MSKACVCGDPVSLCLKGKKKWYSLLRTNRKQKETDVFKCILPIKDFDCKMVPVNVFLGSGRLWPSQHAVCAEEKETCQAEDHVNIHPGGGRPKHCSLRSCSKASFSYSNMRFVAGATSHSTLSGTELSRGTEAQHKGKTKLLSCSISLADLGEQFSTELVSRKRNTFSYVERE